VYVFCPNCNNGLPPRLLRTESVKTACPSCLANLTVEVFPALFRSTVRVDAGALAEGEASCYEHPSKRAVALCSHCGRFLCGLCEVEIGESVWCPECLGTNGGSRPKLAALETHRTLYDSMALMLAAWPLLFIFTYLGIFTAPAALYVAIRYWKAPSSIVPRNKWRFVVAIVVALAQLGVIVAGIIALTSIISAGARGRMHQ
jgi:hypothetical protein